jgi:hypothetical protein
MTAARKHAFEKGSRQKAQKHPIMMEQVQDIDQTMG